MVASLLLQGSASHLPLRDESVQCVVTSPPYWGLRQYAGEQREVWGGIAEHAHGWGTEVGHRAAHPQATNGASTRGIEVASVGRSFIASTGAFCACGAWYGALGLEPTPEMYVAHMVAIFREVRRALRKDGTLWLNLGDSYAGSGKGPSNNSALDRPYRGMSRIDAAPNRWISVPDGIKQKDLVGIPWMVAFALRADGWYLRSDIIWAKPNPMPESVTDRPTKAHEYLFLLAKSPRYFYDADAVREPLTESSIARISQPNFDNQTGGEKDYGPGSNRSERRTLENFKRRQTTRHDADTASLYEEGSNGNRLSKLRQAARAEGGEYGNPLGRNKRTVWNIATHPYPGAHFATYPEQLVEPCILAGSAPGGTILDPFNGSGTTGRVAIRHGRNYVGLDISREYLVEQAAKRIDNIQHVMQIS